MSFSPIRIHCVGMQRYAKSVLRYGKPILRYSIAIHLVSSGLSVTAPSSVLFNSKVINLASITHCNIFSYSLCPSVAFKDK